MKKTSNESGFTLVELMVVVAIIGILSAVAIPNFKRYQAKTKTSEAKLQLSALYSAQTALQSDYDSFATCSKFAGYSPPTANNYYAIGFTAGSTNGATTVDANVGTGTPCATDAGSAVGWSGDKTVALAKATPAHITNIDATGLDNSGGDISTPNVSTNGSYFVAGAIGPIDPDYINSCGGSGSKGDCSEWAINENKQLQEVEKGY